MKTNRNSLLVLIIISLSTITSRISSQTIQINTDFTKDSIIYPFNGIDRIFSLKISGTVRLLSDTSLVRIIVIDQTGNQFLAFEAYPLIAAKDTFSIYSGCDETCFTEGFWANSNNHNLTFDSIQVNNLQAMLAIDTLNLFSPTVLARNVLVNEGILDYSEPLIFDSELKSASIRKVYPKILIPNNTTGYLKVYPNPANDYVIVEYQLPENCPQSILKLTSVEGKLIKQFILNSARKEIIVPTDGFPTQLIISILSGDKLIGNKKVIISK